MTRHRNNPADSWMPPRVYRGRYAYEWHPKGGGSKSLCPLTASPAEVWVAYQSLAGDEVVKTVRYIASLYFASQDFTSLSPRTKIDYEAYWKRLDRTFGNMAATALQPEHVRMYMDLRGESSIAMANKEKKLLAIIMRFGQERGYVRQNPCDPVKNFKEKPRVKYITHDEYREFLGYADPTLRAFMNISYVCAARGQDVRKIKLSDFTKEGLFIQQGKTGKRQIKLWTPPLRDVIREAMKIRRERLKGGIVSEYLLVTPTGTPYTEFGLKSMWRRARAKYRDNNGGKDIDWTFHDIKAKAISDYDGDKQMFSGHKSWSMMERYNRTADKVSAILADADVIKPKLTSKSKLKKVI